MRRIIAVITLLAILAGCSPSLPAPVYVVSGDNVGEWFPHSALHILDPHDLRVVRSIDLPRSWVQSAGVDEQGRVWLGLSGTPDRIRGEVWIYDNRGRRVAMIDVGDSPEGGISFAGGLAFVVCRGWGFDGEVSVVDVDTLEVVATIALPRGDYEYSMVTASAADERYLIVTAQHSSPQRDPPPVGVHDLPWSEVYVIDVETLAVMHRLSLGGGTAVWDVASTGDGQFLLANNAGFQARLSDPDSDQGDILVLAADEARIVDRYQIGGFPFRVELVGDELVVFCRIWSSLLVDERRALVRLDLTTGDYSRDDLPAGFRGTDLAVVDGQWYLVGWVKGRDGQDGLYRVRPGAEPELITAIEDASLVVRVPRW